jgi:hypothetical protein
MLTFQVRPRAFKTEKPVTFPNRCKVELRLAPKQPFGEEAGGGRTTVQHQPAKVTFNANTGAHYVQSEGPLSPLDVTIEGRADRVTLNGTHLVVVQDCKSWEELDGLVQGLYYGFPMILNVYFADPPYVLEVFGDIGGTPFRWELSEWKLTVSVTNQQSQEEAFAKAWRQMDPRYGPGCGGRVAARRSSRSRLNA